MKRRLVLLIATQLVACGETQTKAKTEKDADAVPGKPFLSEADLAAPASTMDFSVEQLKDEIKVRGLDRPAPSAAPPDVLGSFRGQHSRPGCHVPVLPVSASPSPFASREAPDAVRSGDVRGQMAERR